MVRKSIIFGLALLTMSGLLTSCATTDGGLPGGAPSSTSAKAQKAVENFQNAFDEDNAQKAYDLLDKSSYGGQKVDEVILPKDMPQVQGQANGKVTARVVALSFSDKYLDAQYELDGMNLDPSKTYGVFEGTYEAEVASTHGAFEKFEEADLTVPVGIGGANNRTTIGTLFFGNVSNEPEVTNDTIAKIVKLYSDAGIPLEEDQLLRQGYRINEDTHRISIPLSDEVINPNPDVPLPREASYNSTTDEWSDLR
jgi:hypothetical protein